MTVRYFRPAQPLAIQRIVARLQVTSKEDWWSALSNEQQKQYMAEHPNSEKTKQFKAEQPDAQPDDPATEAPKTTEAPNDDAQPAADDNTKKHDWDAESKLPEHKPLSGPKDDADSLSGDAHADREVVALLDKLKEMTDEAQAKGEKAPDYDLCQVSVPGTNLFCAVNKDIPRAKMPQLKGRPEPGSPAADMPKDKGGEVDTEPAFKEALEKKGIKLVEKSVPAATLKATQSQLVGSKVAGMCAALKKDPNNPGITAPIFVSKDGYVLDGHHRWAAVVGLQMAKGGGEPVEMKTIQVDMSIEDLLKFSNEFCEDIGIKPKDTKSQAKLQAKVAIQRYKIALQRIKRL